MNLRTLRYFIAVADAGSMTAAAHAIPIAQPALTRQIRELEADLGAQLFQRLPRGVLLTSAGAIFYESAQRILAEETRLKEKLAREHNDVSELVGLGAPPTLARLILPGLFEKFATTLMGINLQIREAFTPELLNMLKRGVIDMAVVTNPEPDGQFSIQPLIAEPFALVTHRDMGIPPVVLVRDLQRIPVLLTSLHREIIERQLLPLGQSLNVQSEIDSVDAIRELVMRGGWATIMPVSVFKDAITSQHLVMSEITGCQLNRQLVLATSIERRPAPASSLVRELVDSEFSRLSRQGIFSFGQRGAGQIQAER